MSLEQAPKKTEIDFTDFEDFKSEEQKKKEEGETVRDWQEKQVQRLATQKELIAAALQNDQISEKNRHLLTELQKQVAPDQVSLKYISQTQFDALIAALPEKAEDIKTNFTVELPRKMYQQTS